MLSSANAFSLVQSENLLFGREIMTLRKKPIENIVGNGENASNQHSSFPTIFVGFQIKKKSIVLSYLCCCLQNLTIFTSFKFCHLVKSYWIFYLIFTKGQNFGLDQTESTCR